MSSFVFNDLLPIEGEFKVRAIDFVGRGVTLYDYQRHENPERVKEIVDEQNRHETLLFSTPFIVVHIEGVHKLCDGQHRLSALRQLIKHPNIEKLEVHVLVYLCGDNVSLAQRIYLQCNSQYMQNCAIDRKEGVVVDVSRGIREVVDHIRGKYSKQIGKNYFPCFDPNQLEKELLCSRVRDLSSKEIVDIVINENAKFGKVLRKVNSKYYGRCENLDGFFLVAKKPGCRWVHDL
jgi:hypothetical protein